MTYVALSRGVSMERMRVTGFSAQSVRSNPKWGRVCGVRGRVVAFYTAIGQGRVFVPYRRSGGVSQGAVQMGVGQGAVQRGVSQPSAVQRGVSQPSAVQMGVSQPSAVQMGVSQPSAVQMGVSQPSAIQMGVGQGAVHKGVVQRSVVPSGGSDTQQNNGNGFHPNNANHTQKQRNDTQSTHRKREATPRQTNASTTMPSQLKTKPVTPTPRKEQKNSLVGLALALQQFNKSFSSLVWKQTRTTKYIYKLFSLFDKSST